MKQQDDDFIIIDPSREEEERQQEEWDEFVIGDEPDHTATPPELDEEDRAFVEEPKPEREEPEAEDCLTEPRASAKVMQYIGYLLSGNILSTVGVRRHYSYLAFVAGLMTLYITNGFSMHKLHFRHDALKAEVRELRLKALTFGSMKMNATRQSVVDAELAERGSEVRVSFDPPKIVGK